MNNAYFSVWERCIVRACYIGCVVRIGDRLLNKKLTIYCKNQPVIFLRVQACSIYILQLLNGYVTGDMFLLIFLTYIS